MIFHPTARAAGGRSMSMCVQSLGGALNRKRDTVKFDRRSFEKVEPPRRPEGLERSNGVPRADGLPRTEQLSCATPLAVLKELFDLLEEYGPVWYTQELYERIQAALSNYQKTA
jgi:hypothetical protein